MDKGFFNRRAVLEKVLCLVVGAEAHHPLDQRSVVPTAIEDHDLARGRKVRNITLNVNLRFLAVGRSGQRDDPEHARTHTLGYAFDDTALSSGIAGSGQNAGRALVPPHGAAIAGVIFAVLMSVGWGLARYAVPADPSQPGVWLTDPRRREAVKFALTLVPFAGIAFLWFMGVLR